MKDSPRLHMPSFPCKRKCRNFEWTSKCEESFQRLKNLLTSAPVLKVGDPEKCFVGCTDACGQGFGKVLVVGISRLL